MGVAQVAAAAPPSGVRARRNVRLTLAFRALDGAATGIWSGSVLSNYISLLFGSTPAGNQQVGVAQAVLGTALAATAVPLGWVADKRVPRHLVLRAAGVTSLLAAAATLHALSSPTAVRFHLLCVSLALWGVAQGSGPVLDALFADSVATGGRETIYTAAQIASLLSRAVGPLLSALLFERGGNTWSLDVLSLVMVTGQLLALVPACLLLFFCASDLGSESEGLSALLPLPPAAPRPPEAAVAAQGAAFGREERRPLLEADAVGASEGGARQAKPVGRQAARLEQEQEQDGREQAPQQAGGFAAAGDEAEPGAQVEGAGRVVATPGCAALEGEPHTKPSQQSGGARAAARVAVWCVESDEGEEAASLLHEVPGEKPPVAAEAPQLRPGQVQQQAPSPPKLDAAPAGASGGVSSTSSGSACEGVASCHVWWRQSSWLTPAAIPPMLSVSDCISGLASGMTISYFPIFFKDEVGLTPTALSLLLALVPAGLAICSVAARWLGRYAGRVQAIAAFKTIGISLLFSMAVRRDIWRRPALVLPIYVIRTCLMNATPALQKSILMDYAPKSQRGRWSSIDAVTNFGWSGSALLGGIVIRRHGFAAVFAVTSAMQLVSLMLLCTLLPLVPRRQAAPTASCGG